MPAPNIQAFFDALFDESIAAALAADEADDAAEIAAVKAEAAAQLQAALAADALQDAEVIAAKDATIATLRDGVSAAQQVISGQSAEIAALKARVAELEGSQPDPEPEPEPEPPATGTAPIVADFKKLATAAARQAFITQAEQWYRDNTGVRPGVALAAYNGSYNISAANVTIKGKRLTRSLQVTGANFVMEDCEVAVNDTWGVDAEGASNPTIRFCTFKGPNGGGNSAYLGTGTFEFNDVSGWQNGITHQGKGSIAGNYIHNLGPSGAAGEAHVDGIQIQGGIRDLVVTGNFIRAWDTSCIIFSNDFGANNNVKIERNWLLNHPGKKTAYAAYFTGDKGGTTNSSLADNVVERGNAGYFSIVKATPVPFTGNVDVVTGGAVNG